jgi:hypothetical protein
MIDIEKLERGKGRKRKRKAKGKDKKDLSSR